MCRAGGRRCPGQHEPGYRDQINAKRRARYAATRSGESVPVGTTASTEVPVTSPEAPVAASEATLAPGVSYAPHPLEKAPSEPMTFRSAHNTVSSKEHGIPDPTRFDRHVEPAGRYIVNVADDFDQSGWEVEEVTFNKPLHLELGDYGDPSSWKLRLSEHYGGSSGKKLSKDLAKDGYDGIVTSDKYGFSEIVDLRFLHKK